MVIRKKDGNVYVLEGPNPIVAGQATWDPKNLVFHNFSWDEITYSQEAAKRRRPEYRTTQPPETKPAPIVETTRKPPEAAPTTSTTPEAEGREFDLPYIKYKVLCYCLPAKTKVHVDRLYGESWQKTTYGNKFVFPCVIIESSDITMEFWTSDPRTQIDEKSIIYPFSYEVHNKSTDSYDKVPYDEYRWWKVSEKESKEGGWHFRCVPSESHPDFSD
jgi:hypothetical protein